MPASRRRLRHLRGGGMAQTGLRWPQVCKSVEKQVRNADPVPVPSGSGEQPLPSGGVGGRYPKGRRITLLFFNTLITDALHIRHPRADVCFVRNSDGAAA